MKLDWISSAVEEQPGIALLEATTPWVGPIRSILGNGKYGTLHYGSMSDERAPFLYVPLPLDIMRQAKRQLRNTIIVYDHQKNSGEILRITDDNYKKWALELPYYMEVIENPEKALTHVGEAHVTIAQDSPRDDELSEALLELADDPISALLDVRMGGRPLFDEYGSGIAVDVQFNNKKTIRRALYYRDDIDDSGPFIVMEVVDVPLMPFIRKAIGLSPFYTFPNGSQWIPHVTLGYIAKRNIIHQSYLERHGRGSGSHSVSPGL